MADWDHFFYNKNCAVRVELIWFDLPISLHTKKEVCSAWTAQWYGFRFCRRISFIASDTYGADRTPYLTFSCCLVSTEHDLAHMGFLFAFQNNFPGLLVRNARKREKSRKTAINFPFDGRLGPVFLYWNENDKNCVMGGEFSWFEIPIKLHKKTKMFLGPKQSNGMVSASIVASPSSLLTPIGLTEHNL